MFLTKAYKIIPISLNDKTSQKNIKQRKQYKLYVRCQ